MVRLYVLYDEPGGLLTALLTSSGVIAFLFTFYLVTFHRLVCELFVCCDVEEDWTGELIWFCAIGPQTCSTACII